MLKLNAKSFVFGVLISSILFTCTSVFATGIIKTIKATLNAVTVKIDDKVITGDNIIYNNNIYIRVDKLGTALDKSFTWDKKKNLVQLAKKVLLETAKNVYPEATDIKGDISNLLIKLNVDGKFPSSDLKDTILESYDFKFENGMFLMMYGKYSNMGNYFVLLDGIYKAFPTVAEQLKDELSHMEIRTYKGKLYINVVNLRQFLLASNIDVNMFKIDNYSYAISVILPTSTPSTTPIASSTATSTPTSTINENNENEYSKLYTNCDSSDGMTVNINKVELTNSTSSKGYYIEYTLTNNTNANIDIGYLKAYLDNGNTQDNWGHWGYLKPSESISKKFLGNYSRDSKIKYIEYNKFTESSNKSDNKFVLGTLKWITSKD